MLFATHAHVVPSQYQHIHAGSAVAATARCATRCVVESYCRNGTGSPAAAPCVCIAPRGAEMSTLHCVDSRNGYRPVIMLTCVTCPHQTQPPHCFKVDCTYHICRCRGCCFDGFADSFIGSAATDRDTFTACEQQSCDVPCLCYQCIKCC